MMFTLVPTAMAEGDEAPAGGEPTPVETHAVKTTKTGDVTYSADDAKIENLVYTSGTMTVTGANVTIENVTFGDNAALVVNTTGDFTLTNCQFAPNTEYGKDGNVGVRTAVYLKIGGTATVTNNTFEGVDNGYYNAIEFGIGDDHSLKNATISGNTFTKTIKNNYFNFYNMQEGAVINITNNQFLLANKSSNGIRISNNKNVSATFNLDSNTYTYAATSADSEYEGLILLQDYSKKDAGTQDFTKITINITNLTSPEDAKQILYVYDDQDGIIQTNQPVVKGDSSIEKFFVAKVGDTYYKTLAEAVAAAKNDETVTLLKNAEMTETIRITDGKKITLALDGHDVVIKTTGKFFLVRNGELTVTGTGMIKEETPYFAPIIIKGGAENSENYSVVNVEKGVILEGWAGVMIDQTSNTTNNYGMVLNVNGATLKGVKDTDNAEGLGVYVNGVVADAKVTLNNATLTADGYGMYLAGNADTTITGGTVSGTTTGIEIRAGKLTLDNCDVTGGSGEVTKNANGNGSTVNNAALAISQHTTKKDIDVTINGGTYTGTAAVYQTDVQGTGSENVKVNVNNGKFNGTVVGETANKLSITGGYFTSDPTAYLAASHYVWASDKDGYTYMVKNTAPTSADQKITVVDKTDTAVSSDITGNDEDAINGVISKANVDGVAEAVAPAKKADIVAKSSATVAENDKVEIEVAVKVEAKAADLANGKLTFEASPVATVKVNGTATGTTVPVTNDMLNGNAITVKLPLPTGFKPEQIKHISSDGSVEYFLKTAKRGANTFEIKDGCAVFTITKFSTFELSGTVTYVEPSYYSGSSSDPTYSVTVDKTENGSVTVSPKSASKGSTVTITVKPDSGYTLETLTAIDSKGKEIQLTDKGEGKYTFTMPAGKVEVKATFMEDNSMLNFFYDVPNGAYFYEAVKWAVENGITTGVGNDLFAPEQPCTRAQIVTFLWRAAGSPEPKTASSFTDVPANAYYAKAVAWAVENGITNGMTATEFAPDATCTRGQSVTFLYRALKGTASGSANFTDVASDAFYADAISWAVANNVTNGTSNTTFSPNADCTRAEIVTFLYRAYQGK